MGITAGIAPGMIPIGIITDGRAHSASTMAADGTTVGVDITTIGIVLITDGIPTTPAWGITAAVTGTIIAIPMPLLS